MNRAAGFGVTFRDYVDTHKDKLLGVVQVETVEAVEKVDEIAAVEGADVLFIGPLDLSTSLGILGQLDHPDFVAALKKTAEAARKHGKTTGVLMPNPGFYEKFQELGYRFLACGSDGAMVNNAARDLAGVLKEKRDAAAG
jgi:4-hydroxy-2-oxoheptanedioate aldolase